MTYYGDNRRKKIEEEGEREKNRGRGGGNDRDTMGKLEAENESKCT